MSGLTIRGARTLDAGGLVDVAVSGGVIASVTAAGPAAGGAGAGGAGAGGAGGAGDAIDAAGGLLLPGFVECHFHPDKALTFPRVGPVRTTSLQENMARGAAVKRDFTHADVVARASAALELAVAQGVTGMRAQVDVDTVCGLTGIEAMLEVRERFRGVLDLQLVAFPQEAVLRDPGVELLLAEALALGADLVGGGPTNEESPAHAEEHLRRLFAIAGTAGRGLDVHIDLAEDPAQRTLALLARMTIERGYEGRVTASHCCALAAYPEDAAQETIALVRRAGIQICVCPMSNLLLGSPEDEPRGRGASRPKALLRAGVNVATGSDNVNDMWFRFGRLDLAEVAMVSALACGMRTDAEVRDALDMVTVRAARFAGLPDAGIVPGAPADLVLFSATTIEDVLRGVPGSRRTIKAGRVVAGLDAQTWCHTDAHSNSERGSALAALSPAS